MRFAVAAAAAVAAVAASRAPIRGWNSWDTYVNWNGDQSSGNIPESDIPAAAQWMASNLLPYGWDTFVVDEGWYYDGANEVVDANGRPTPNPAVYPSAGDGRGFKTLSDQIHALGLKFGVWTLRGIPRAAVAKNAPIYGSNYTAAQAQGPTSDDCEWSSHMYATNAPAPAAIAWFHSLAQWYSQQGIDYVKVDCMWPTQPNLPYHTPELVAFANAMAQFNISVSTSPGAYVSPQNASFMTQTQLAAAYRVTQDFWDSWDDNGKDKWPTGLASKFDTAVQFADYFPPYGNGASPDLDMLPLGRIMHASDSFSAGPSETHLTQPMQQMVMSLWCMTGAPLMFGGRMPLLDNETFTLQLLTNRDLLWVHEAATIRQPLTATAPGGYAYAWAATTPNATYIALFNTNPGGGAYYSGGYAPLTVNLTAAGLDPSLVWCGFDVWNGYYVPARFADGNLTYWMPGQATVTLRMEPCTTYDATIAVDTETLWRPVSGALYSAFIENINRAVEGGLSAQMVQDYQCSGVIAKDSSSPWLADTNSTGVTATIAFDTSAPLNANTSTSLRLDVVNNGDASAAVGVCNTGFNGMAVAGGSSYEVSFFARTSVNIAGTVFTVSLESASGETVYASSSMAYPANAGQWQELGIALNADASDPAGSARLCIRAPAASGSWSLWLKGVSSVPASTYMQHGLRTDLAEYVAAVVSPGVSALRMVGGAFILGSNLTDMYNITRTIGPQIERAGHWDLWGYVSEDLMGYHEWLQFSEDIGAPSIFVANAGISNSHSFVLPGPALQPFVDHVLAGLDYALADPASNYWASLRAANGHPAPFDLRWLAIGNENCYSGWGNETLYAESYPVIASAVRTRYPNVTLIANCDITSNGTVPVAGGVDLWDYHIYQGSADNFIQQQFQWDDWPRGPGIPKVFASEYATVTSVGNGNLQGALGEAAWMIGLERNSDAVPMAAYAPFFSRIDTIEWGPNAVYYNNSASFGAPSYWNQRLFATNNLVPSQLAAFSLSAASAVHSGKPLRSVLAAGAINNTIANLPTSVSLDANGDVVIKAVNFGGNACALTLTVSGKGAALPSVATLSSISSGSELDTNSLDDPFKVAIQTSVVPTAGPVTLPPLSINVVRLTKAVARA